MDDLQDIYQTYADEVKRFLICITSDIDLAEELTQETFYQAVKSIKRYNGTCKMSVWLCQIAKHSYYNYLKKEKNHPCCSVENMLQNGDEITDRKDLPEIKIAKRDTYVSIHKQIHLLPEPYREVFLLRVLSELNYREIGEIFSQSENWARVTYYRAKTKLSERISGN